MAKKKKKGDWLTPEQRAEFNRIAAFKARASGKACRWDKTKAREMAKKSAAARAAKRKLSNLDKNTPKPEPTPVIELPPGELPDLP